MKVLENSYAVLPNGAIVELTGRSLNDITYIRERDINWQVEEDRRNDATKYAQFSVGGRSFTIQNNNEDVIALLKDKAKRITLASVKLEASEYNRAVLDPETNEPTGETMTVKSFRFISATTVDDAMAFAKSEGAVAQEEAKWAPKTASVSQANIDAAVNKSMDAFLAKFMEAQKKGQPAANAAEVA